MPICKNNSKKQYTGDEPSPKGLGYCASGEKEGKIMKGKDRNTWIVSKGRWIKHQNDDYYKILMDKLSKWWQQMAQGNIIIIYQDGKHKLVTSLKKTRRAKSNDIINKWKEYNNDKNIKAILWSAQSWDVIQFFINRLIKKSTKEEIKELIKMKDLPDYLIANYKKYFEKYEYIGKKDYHLKKLID